MDIMETIPERSGPAARYAAVYDAAADWFDAAPLAFWDHTGTRTVDLIRLRPGETVLDVGCGTGASALRASRQVGSEGQVVGIDVAERLLARARAKAKDLGLSNVEFRHLDMTATGFADRSFDAVVSVFSIFFVEDMERQIAELWRLVRPGGRLAVTTWAPRMLEPGASLFWQEVRRRRPDLAPEFRPAGRVTDADSLRRLFRDGGAAEPEIFDGAHVQRLAGAEDWWTIVLGSGLRETADAMTPEDQQAVRSAVERRIRRTGISGVEADAIHAVAWKPAAS